MTKINYNFPFCGGCSRKKEREGLGAGEYYCVIADAIMKNGGVVTDDVDATECTENEWYIPIRQE